MLLRRNEPAGEPKAAAEIDDIHGHPHEEPHELPVVEGSQSPELRSSLWRVGIGRVLGH
jgi:hypothetical protein